jgi:hypothetical protein
MLSKNYLEPFEDLSQDIDLTNLEREELAAGSLGELAAGSLGDSYEKNQSTG